MLHSSIYTFLKVFKKKKILSGYTWLQLRRNKPYFVSVQKEKRKKYFISWINNAMASAFICTLAILVPFACCFVPETVIAGYFDFLKFIKFQQDYTDASTLISDTLGSAATIVGLSFVVIGLLIETVKNQNKVNYDIIFRSSGMYYGFSFSITGLLFLVFFNLMKFGFDKYVMGNLAILSCAILFTITLSIGIIFFRFLWFLRPGIFEHIAKTELLFNLKLQLLNEKRITFRNHVYGLYWRSLHFRENSVSFGQKDNTWIGIEIKPDEYLHDVMLPLLRFFIARITRRAKPEVHEGYPLTKSYQSKHLLFKLTGEVKLNAFDRLLLKTSFVLKKNRIQADYKDMRRGYENQLIDASRKDNKERVLENLQLISEIYLGYYQSK